MMKIIFLFFCLSGFLSVHAQDEEIISTSSTLLTPFTGCDYIRLVFTKKDIIPGKAFFQVTISDPVSKKNLWQGNVVPAQAINEGGDFLSVTIKNLNPVLWEPVNPFLYNVTLNQIINGSVKKTFTERAGFRSFERKGGNLFLNGKPIFLRGIAINPPGRGIPDSLENSRAFAQDYVRFMKSINVNIIRIPDAEIWYNVCDEMGMMVFGGNYSAKVAAGAKINKQQAVTDEGDNGFPNNYDDGVRWYENEKLGSIAHHPSLVVYAMTNETPYAGQRAEEWEKFLSYAYNKLKAWDETRAYIANAGYGYGKTGDITDLHRYWGWYYSSPFTFLNARDETKINPYPSKDQPITFTEAVGNYTGPDGRYNLTPGHKNPSSSLTWNGHAAENIQAQLADYHQSFTFKIATETLRQLRTINKNLSGIFPFTILFYNWETVHNFLEMNPKPVTEQVRISYQPVLLSWECWTPNVFAGSTVSAVAHIINDANNFSDLQNAMLYYELQDKAHTVVYKDSLRLQTIKYFQSSTHNLKISIPQNIATGDYTLDGKVLSASKIVSQNSYSFFIADNNFTTSSLQNGVPVLLYDKIGNTKNAFQKLNIKIKELDNFNNLSVSIPVVIGENAADELVVKNIANIKKFVADGGRLIVLKQDINHRPNAELLFNHKFSNNNIDIDDPRYPVSDTLSRNGYYVNAERPDHPVFSGISRANLRLWSDYTNWTEKTKGLPAIQPVTDGFSFINYDDAASTTVLANYGYGLQGIALAEQYQGKGSILNCGLDIAARAGIDPIASRLVLNLIIYSLSTKDHEQYQLITAPITWGDFSSEKGIVTDLYSGLILNATPRVDENYLGKGIVVTADGNQLAGGQGGGWNTRPGIQYVANGRRPFGPFLVSVGRSPVPDKTVKEGTGSFWCRIPVGQNSSTSLIWNPSKVPLQIKIKVNELSEVIETIGAGERKFVTVPVDAELVHMRFTGDRRLVILETAFSEKK